MTEAKKAAEAALITRREETAVMRSQSNTARIFEANPTLMRLEELETLEKSAEKAKLSVVLGEKGLVEKVVKMFEEGPESSSGSIPPTCGRRCLLLWVCLWWSARCARDDGVGRRSARVAFFF